MSDSTGTKYIEAKPVFDEEGEVLLYDLFRDEEWVGSRRTHKQSRLVAEQENRILKIIIR